MLLITILGMPDNVRYLTGLTDRIKMAVENRPIFGVNGDEVSVFYQPDL